MSITIAVADDHTLFRQGLRELLSTDPEVDVVGEGASGDEALALVRRHRPDVLLLDVEMPGPSAQETVRRVRREHPGTAVVVLTMHEEPGMVRRLLDSGAAAYLVKSIGREELLATMHSVSRGDENVMLSVPRTTIESMDRQANQGRVLSPRELEVLRLVASALSNAQIATRLRISEGTVKRHLTNVYAKLDATSRVDAINQAVRAKLIDGHS
jgi:DNA-binding NarL/FixJ family response regulator